MQEPIQKEKSKKAGPVAYLNFYAKKKTLRNKIFFLFTWKWAN
jgi:hypothetical protein